jgi:hypothetical protein
MVTIEVKSQFILVADIIDGKLVKKKYIGYTKAEAKKKFIEEFKNKKP